MPAPTTATRSVKVLDTDDANDDANDDGDERDSSQDP